MENVLLIGLSRQTALQRELDIVANNIANVNTTGFKADGAVFAEFLQNRASSEQFLPPDRRMSMVQDRMSWHDMNQGSVQQTKGPLDIAIDGEGMIVVQTPRGERYTRNGALQLNSAGEIVTLTGDKVLGDSGPIVLQATDQDIEITKDGTVKVRRHCERTAPAPSRRPRACSQRRWRTRAGTSCRARSRNRTSARWSRCRA